MKISDTLYKVRVPYIATYSPEELELYGMPVSYVDGAAVKSGYDRLVQVEINLDAMIEIYMRGYSINLVDVSKAHEIYETMDNYARDLKEGIHSDLNMIQIDERLEDIDRFLNDIFNYNKIDIVRKSVAAPVGYGLNIQLYNPNTTAKTTDNSGLIIATNDGRDNYSVYTQTSGPDLDMDQIKRKSLYRRGTFNKGEYRE